jgi:twitching motility protein PilT
MGSMISNINKLLKAALVKEASDIHIKAGAYPTFRINREIFLEDNFPKFSPDDTRELLNELILEEQRQAFYRDWELDFAYNADNIGRFRVNAYFQLGTVSLSFRLVRTKIPTFKQLGLPDVCEKLALQPNGMIILTGPTGCGKSTTLAAMIDFMNKAVKRNIITIEDPIEFLHEDKKSIISQREVGRDTDSFSSALRRVLRQDPDVILIGEMRDLETVSIALTAAETGHLILTTLHTPSSYGAIERIVDAFPPNQHRQVRLQLSTVLRGVLYQVLIPRSDDMGVIPAVETLIATPAIVNLIRENQTYEMINYMHTGREVGMQTLDQAIIDLQKTGKIRTSEALSHLRSYSNTERSELF